MPERPTTPEEALRIDAVLYALVEQLSDEEGFDRGVVGSAMFAIGLGLMAGNLTKEETLRAIDAARGGLLEILPG